MNRKKGIITVCILIYMLFIGYKYQIRQRDIIENSDDTLTVVTSFYPMYVHTKELMKNTPHTLVNMASQNVGCLHDYQLTVQDAKKLYDADILVINGLGSENFIEKAYKQNENLQIIDASYEIERQLHDNEDVHTSKEEAHSHSHEHNHDGVNDHAWLSIEGSIMQVKEIKERLIDIDPTYAHVYEENAKTYIEALKTLKAKAKEPFNENHRDLEVVTVHDAFTYMMEELGIEVVETIPEGSYENASAKQIEHLVEHMKEDGIQVIVAEEKNKDLAILKMLENETPCQIYVLDAMVNENETEAQSDRGMPEYVVRMEKNIEILKEAFNE